MASSSSIARRGNCGQQGKYRLGGNPLLVFSPDNRILASLVGGITREDWTKSEVKLWDVFSGEELVGMTEDFGLCLWLVFSPDSRTLVTVEAAGSNQQVPVLPGRFPTTASASRWVNRFAPTSSAAVWLRADDRLTPGISRFGSPMYLL